MNTILLDYNKVVANTSTSHYHSRLWDCERSLVRKTTATNVLIGNVLLIQRNTSSNNIIGTTSMLLFPKSDYIKVLKWIWQWHYDILRMEHVSFWKHFHMLIIYRGGCSVPDRAESSVIIVKNNYAGAKRLTLQKAASQWQREHTDLREDENVKENHYIKCLVFVLTIWFHHKWNWEIFHFTEKPNKRQKI